MGYRSVPGERWQDFLNIPDDGIPRRLIIEGQISYPRFIERRSQVLSDVRTAWMPNLVHGRHADELVAYGVCFGGPIASQFTHVYCKVGTPKVIQIGICGGLQADIELGDIIVSEEVLSLDGSANLYGLADDRARFDRTLRDRAVALLEDLGARYRVGRTVSYFDILLEEGEDLADLSAAGYVGVEMEAAATGSVANHFGVPALAVLAVSDNSISGKDLFHEQSEEERGRVQTAIDAVFDVALGV
jgi:uridine phosphorylase